MSVRIEKNGAVWTVIHDRPEARNAMDPDSADAVTQAFLDFDADDSASVAVFWGSGGAFCAGWDLKFRPQRVRAVLTLFATLRVVIRHGAAQAFFSHLPFSPCFQ